MRIERVNIGEIIREKVEASGMSKAKFAESLNIARQNIEKTVFQKHSIDTDLLTSISEVLGCNLFDYYRGEGECNNSDYMRCRKEVKAHLTIEMGEEKQDKTIRFIFGENEVKILNS